ncbi:MAG: acyl-CoA dehydrogenase family protein [Pseudonocardia sp.]|nr:acyl-CoA dehydrogenase family protein [Pseudonocardia sp.]
MDLLPSADQQELVAAAAEFFAEQVPVSAVRERRADPAAIAPKVWAEGALLGLLGLAADVAVGGSGRPLDDEALLFRELGRALVPGPFLGSVIGARLAALSGAADLAGFVIEGHTLVAPALLRVDDDVATVADGVLTGRIRLLDPAGAEYALVVTDDGAGLVATAALTDLAPVESSDPGTRMGTARAEAVPVTCWVPATQDPIALRGAVLAAAQLVGIAEATRDLSTAHAKTRIQFGRPIGVNQAIKHRCADMAVSAEAALQQTLFAAVSLRSGRADAEFQVRAAKVVAGRAAITNAAETIQVHGGMGYTYEHDAHLYLKRAHVLDQLFGSRTAQLAPLLAQEAAQ